MQIIKIYIPLRFLRTVQGAICLCAGGFGMRMQFAQGKLPKVMDIYCKH